MTSTPLPSDGAAPELEIAGAIATIRLCRPQKMNRLTTDDLRLLHTHCDIINADARVRVVVLTAQTSLQSRPVFCAGFDIGSFDSPSQEPRLFEQTVNRLASLRPVLLCGLNGSVYGGATDLVLACDVRIGLEGLEFKMPALALGLHYYPSGLRRYVQSFGLDRARQAFLTARAFSADQLVTAGVLMACHDSEVFEGALRHLAQDIAALAPLAASATKQSLKEIASGEFDLTPLQQRETLTHQSQDFAEGRKAFAERRSPIFRGI